VAKVRAEPGKVWLRLAKVPDGNGPVSQLLVAGGVLRRPPASGPDLPVTVCDRTSLCRRPAKPSF